MQSVNANMLQVTHCSYNKPVSVCTDNAWTRSRHAHKKSIVRHKQMDQDSEQDAKPIHFQECLYTNITHLRTFDIFPNK